MAACSPPVHTLSKFDSAASTVGKSAAQIHAAAAALTQWWQQILLYPAFAAALVSAGPEWIDKAKGFQLGVDSASKAQREAQLWRKNATCLNLNSSGYMSPSGAAVDATICKSGDILVRAVTPQSREIYKWLPLDDVVPTEPQSTASSLIPSAQAATISTRRKVRQLAAPMFKVALLQSVQCTRSDGRYLHRVVQTPSGCFREVIDTFTGALVSRNQVPCGSGC